MDAGKETNSEKEGKGKFMKTLEGKLVSKEMKIGIVAARFNEFITSKLLSGAMDGLLRHDVREEDVEVAWVPGAFEVPLIASKMAKSGKYDAVICLGAVIRGSTSHYDYVCNEVSKGIAAVSLETGICLEFLQPKISSRQLSGQAQKQEIKAMTVPWARLKWLI